jgi:hydrogenase large subunit
MAQLISIDPVTRIEGHLRMDVEIENGVVKDAWSSGSMFRGFEMLLKGKHPWDAQQVTERICGVCPMAHGTAASYNLDSALGVQLPDNARIIRNVMLGANFLQSHILHFYHLSALDYVDITAVANYSGNDPALQALKGKIVGLVKANDPYPFLPRYESNDYVSDPTLATTLVSHYVQALEMRKKAQEAIAVMYGRMPSFVGTIPGGVTVQPTVSMIEAVRDRIAEIRTWIDNVYIQDILTVAGVPAYAPFLSVGDSGGNYLAYGGFDQDQAGKVKFLPPGVITNSDIMNPAAFDSSKITESVAHSWYSNSSDPLPPAQGQTNPDVNKEGAYSFIKAPRYDSKAMEVGPLARMLVMKPKVLVDLATNLGLLQNMKFGILPRHAARAIEASLIAKEIDTWLNELQPGQPIWDKRDLPNEAYGMGLLEAPRGALGHWIHIKDKKIDNYQAVVPTTWNASPRDNNGIRGPIENSLIGVPVPDVNNPINVVRTIRSFDPCLACAIHVIHPEHNGVKVFRVV